MTERTQPRGRGMFFEEFSVGDELESVGRTITETDVVAFAGVTGDWNQLHTDAEFAAKTPFGARIAHGLLGLSIASGLLWRLGFIEGTALAFRSVNDWKFSKAIYIGDTIRVRGRVLETKPVPRLGGGQVTIEVSVVNQRDEVAQRGAWVVLVQGRAGGV